MKFRELNLDLIFIDSTYTLKNSDFSTIVDTKYGVVVFKNIHFTCILKRNGNLSKTNMIQQQRTMEYIADIVPKSVIVKNRLKINKHILNLN